MQQHQQKRLRSEGQKGRVMVVALRAPKVRISELWPCCWAVASPASCHGPAVHTGRAGLPLSSRAALHSALRVPETQEGCSSACASFREARPRLKVGSNADFAFQRQCRPHKHPGSERRAGRGGEQYPSSSADRNYLCNSWARRPAARASWVSRKGK